MKLRITLCLLAAMSTPTLAQSGADAAKAKAALAAFAKLVGQWEGEARVNMTPGQPAQVVRQHEDIYLTSGGTVLMVVGTGRSTEAATQGDVVFSATATIGYDNATNKLRMFAKRSDRDSLEADIQMRPDTLIWGFPVKGGRIRFTIAYSSTDWHEVGHFIPQGKDPIPTIEMRLKKLK